MLESLLNKPRHDLQLNRLRSILPKLFGEMDDELFLAVLPYLNWKELPGGHHLFHQGDQGDSLFILISGRLQVVVRLPDGNSKVIGEIARGETVGEMAIFTGEPRSAGVVAVRDSVLVGISKEAFEEMIARSPTMVMNITRLIIGRLKQRNMLERNPFKVVNIALVPLTPAVRIEEFSQLLFRKMNRHGEAMHLTGKAVGQLLNDEDIAYAPPTEIGHYRRLTAWLDEQEAAHDYMVYEADPAVTEWTKRCLRQADEILLIANEGEGPVLSPVENALLVGDHKITTANQALVLLHHSWSKEMPYPTKAWLAPRKLRFHHHIVEHSEKDMERLARLLTGNAIGLALSGGGAKGFAHIGIYKALEEIGFPVDVAGGTSIGGIIAGLIAMGKPFHEVDGICRKAFIGNPTPLGDYNLFPLISLLKGRKLDRLLQAVFGENTIEDQWLNYFCISTNLSKSQAKIHTRGSLKKAIRASISLPGIFPPVVDNGDLLIDGGIFNNLPIDVMGEMGAGRIVAVDLDIERDYCIGLESLPSNWAILKDRFFKKPKYNLPSMMATLVQATTLNSDNKSRQLRMQADLCFHPSLGQFGLMEWKAYDKIVEAGYRHAMEVLEQWEGFG
ncbi:MAG: patatin-like phospholipase family protein [Lewinellaceae bacterium]|nr:patatin-like phospholipase family protein [Lewinellaceae bacterium]